MGAGRIFYKVLDAESGRVVAEGDAHECANRLAIPYRSFYAFVFRAENNRKSKYKVIVKKLSQASAGYNARIYTVTDKVTGEIIVSGSSVACAKKLNITIRTFYDLVTKAKNDKSRRYRISVENKKSV